MGEVKPEPETGPGNECQAKGPGPLYGNTRPPIVCDRRVILGHRSSLARARGRRDVHGLDTLVVVVVVVIVVAVFVGRASTCVIVGLHFYEGGA